MKFTEGYWLGSEHVRAYHASEAYDVKATEGGMRILAPARRIVSRGDTLNLPTVTVEFRAVEEEVISVRAWHYEGYEKKEPKFAKKEKSCPVTVTVTEDEAVMVSGRLTVRVDRKKWGYRFEADGKILTSCGFHNLSHMTVDKRKSTMLPGDDYLSEEGKTYMLTELSLQPGECVYGLGERFGPFVKNGQSLETWNEDGGTSSQIAYKSIPFYMTNKGYGVLVDHTDNVSFEVGSEKVEYVGFSVPGEELEYLFFYGPAPKKIISTYTRMLGRPALVPAWSFGLWLSTSFTTNYDEETTSSFIGGMEEREIPLSVFHFDCFWMKGFQWCDFEWDADAFPDVRGMLRRYHDRGLKICVWINPYIAQGTPFFREGMEHGYFLKRRDGRGVWQTDNWQAGMAVVDFTNPEACRWYSDKLRTLLEMGVDCFKTDFGERIPINVVYYDGSDPVSMHNYYTYLYNQCVFNLLKEEKGEKEAVVFARSATAGCQQFPVHWGGDCMASYASMAETLRGGLSFAMSGFSFWSHDISGFESTATPDLYKRWSAFGLLSTHSRLHGSGSYRVPWLFDEEAVRVLKFFAQLKCTLMPYLYAKAVEASATGIPVMRPMVLEYPEDPACPYLDAQYMLGDAILVAPIFNEEGKVNYYLPQGRWTDYLSGEVKEGGRFCQGVYDYFSLPLYIRENTMLAVGGRKDRPDYDYRAHSVIHLYELTEGAEASCTLVDTDGKITDTITAVRRENTITVKGSRSLKGLRFMVHGRSKDGTSQNGWTSSCGAAGSNCLYVIEEDVERAEIAY